MKRSQSDRPVPQANITLIGTVAALAGLLFGFDTGVISGAQEFLFKTFSIGNDTLYDDWVQGFVVSAVPLGALLGAMMSGIFAERLGRRKTLLFTALLFLLGTCVVAFAFTIHMVLLGRMVMGLAIGISAMVAPMYIGEVSPPNVRGKMIFLFQLAITIGLFGAFAINLLFVRWFEAPDISWRWMFGVGALPSVLLFIGMLYMPYSPRWLAMQGRTEEAKRVLQSLLGHYDVNEELDELEESLQHDVGRNWTGLFRKPLLPLLAISFGLFVFQQLSGINAIMYYGPEVFAKSGFGEDAKFLAQLFMGLTNVLATVLGVWVVDRLGRRPLLFIGFLGMVICLFLLGFLLESKEIHPYASLASILLYVVFFAISLGGVPYILMSEVFPLKMRSSGMAIASCANWGFNMLVAATFQVLITEMGGIGNVFFLYGTFTVIGFIFAMRFVPETKGRHLEQIEHNLYEGKSLRHLGDPVEGQS